MGRMRAFDFNPSVDGTTEDQSSSSLRGVALAKKTFKLFIISIVMLTAGCVALTIFILFAMQVIQLRPLNAAKCTSMEQKDMSSNRSSPHKTSSKLISSDLFGILSNQDVLRYTMRNNKGMVVQVISLGGAITSIQVPDKNGTIADVTTGFDNLTDYETRNGAYFGVLVGRVANRIENGTFSLDGKTYKLPLNENLGQLGNHLHGGPDGWHKIVWKSAIKGDLVEMLLTSPDGDQGGYPGEVKVTVTYQLTDDNELIITYKARTNKPTPINLTIHPYFNLAGEGTAANLTNHHVTIYADKYTPFKANQIPTGAVQEVSGTVYDLRDGKRLDSSLIPNLTDPYFFNINYCLRGPTGRKLAAKVLEETSGRVMYVYTDQPGLQFYTGNFLNVTNGKKGHYYGPYSAFCLETQNYPDAVNHENFPDSILRPGSEYHHECVYQFGIV